MTPTWEFRPGVAPRLVHVSASARWGGVAEVLTGLVPAQAAGGLSVGWAVIDGDAAFFAFSRFLHRLLHGRADAQTAVRLEAAVPRYRATLEPQAEWLAGQLERGDIVVLHDPPTLGLAPTLAAAGLKVVWHCHIGTTEDQASGPPAVWHALGAELSHVDMVVTALPEYAPQMVPPAHRRVIAPALDPVSPKNRVLSKSQIAELLSDAGQVDEDLPLPEDTPVVLQVSRWDPLKDMPGVLRCVSHLPSEAHLVLAGNEPAEHDVEGWAVLDEVRTLRTDLSPADRARVHIVLPDGSDHERTALVVNALQRRADVVLQKSLAEGFGLTVTEAMAKGRAVVASDVGGLRQQISPGHNGLLVNPRNQDMVVEALRTLLDDPLLRRRLGKHAAESVSRRYLMPRLVADYARFVAPDLQVRAHEVA